MKTLVKFVAGSAITGAILGGAMSARVGAGADSGTAVWETPTSPPDLVAIGSRTAGAIRDSGHFLGFARPVDEAPEDETTDQPEVIPFPQIVAASRIDGNPSISLRFPDGTFGEAVAGEEIDGGWRIEAIDIDEVTVSREGRTTTIVVYSGEVIAPVDPEGDATPPASDPESRDTDSPGGEAPSRN